jgi:hypothetical protein
MISGGRKGRSGLSKILEIKDAKTSQDEMRAVR